MPDRFSASEKKAFLTIVALGGILPIVGGYALGTIMPNWRWDHIPFHSVVEGLGACAALILAALLMIMRTHGKLPSAYIWLAAGLVGMGLLDGFHATLYPGQAFVWLHSFATFVGGLLFAATWLPKASAESPAVGKLPLVTLLFATIVGAAALAFPQAVPTMVENGEFTWLARGLNIVGGVGFLAAVAYFMSHHSASGPDDTTVFSLHAFLFGTAGLMFETSALWDAAWWLWHVLRLGAYLVAVYYFLVLYNRHERELQRSYDVLEVKLAETSRENALILQAAGEGIYGVDLQGRCTFVNPAACEMLAMRPVQILGLNAHELIHHTRADGSLYPADICHIFRAFKEGKQATVRDEVFWRSDGTSFPVEYTSTPMVADGEITGAVVVFRDISEAQNLQAQLIHSAKLATLGEMATGVAHELNQPLNVIRMAASNVLRRHHKGTLDPEYMVEKLERMAEQTKRASEIIDHMRIFGRKTERRPHPVDLNEAALNALSLIGEQLRLSGIEVETDLAEGPLLVTGHSVQVEQVCLNLLNNARDAIGDIRIWNEDSSPRKRIAIMTIRDHVDGMAFLKIADTGGGIPPEVMGRIFEPFYTTKEVGKGTGLGLSISYGIVTEMKGDISATNCNGGAEFLVRLPLATAAEVRALAG